ncbi:hypothetical protein IE985_21025 [Klebsiella pneumoniae]|nr:hypothetical protein [Klebsiella pneumoniae]
MGRGGASWGLMDGLAISAVPVAKAGMAAGLFNTVRVAGEGDRHGGRLRGINGKQYPDPAESRSRVCPEVIHRAAGWLGPAICRRRLRFA